MRENVHADMSQLTSSEVATSSSWLPDADLAVYVQEYTRTTFLGGLNWYRVQTQPAIAADAHAFAGRKIDVPTLFVSGSQDWGTYQDPGAVEAMERGESVKHGMYRGTVLVEGAGHWVNQEQPERCVAEILGLVRSLDK